MELNEDQKRLKGLYDQFLEHDTAHFNRQKEDAVRAGQGVNTGLKLFSRNPSDEFRDFELWFPKFALTIIAARTGGGKTTAMINVAVRMAMEGKTGLFITLEEPGFAIRAKMMACHSRITNETYSAESLTSWEATRAIAGHGDPVDMEPFNRAVMRNVRIVDANTTVKQDDIESPTVLYQPEFISGLINYRNDRSERPLDFVIIDFGQLMESNHADNSQSYQRMKAVMQACKNMAGSLGIAVIIGAQMQRAMASVSIWDWEPENIRDGSDMEQAASMVVAIGDDKTYHDQTCNTVLRILKNRNGPKRVAGMFSMAFENCYIPAQGRKPKDDA